MTRLAFLLLALAWPLRRLRAAQDPRPRGPGYPVYFSWGTFQPKLGPFGEPVKMPFKMEYSQVNIEASGNLKVEVVASIEHDLLQGDGTVMVGDVLYEDREIAAAIDAVALREYRKAFPAALPTRRKGLRTVP